MEKNTPLFVEKNAQVIAIAYQDQAGARNTVMATNISYPVLADVDHAVSDAYQVYNTLGDGVATPSIFIINPDGEIVWSYIGQNLSDRPTIEIILENIPVIQ